MRMRYFDDNKFQEGIMPDKIEKKPMTGLFVEVCRKEGLSKTECIRKLNEDIQLIADKAKEKTKNNYVSNAPMSDR
jgi:hypothetical protein